MRNVYLDCEFMPGDLTETGLISIGITSDGDGYYAVNSGMKTAPIRASKWMMENVWPHIPSTRRFILDRSHKAVKDYDTIREEGADDRQRLLQARFAIHERCHCVSQRLDGCKFILRCIA